MEEPRRNLSEAKADMFDDEETITVTSIEQKRVESLIEVCFDRFEQLSALDPNLPHLTRTEHARFLETSLQRLSEAYECLDSSRPWLIYWILNAANLLNVKFTDSLLNNVVDFLVKCRSPEGGFAGGPGQYPHLAPTYAAVNALCIIGTERALNAIHRRSLKKFLHAVREPNGAFRMHVDGETDVRGAYCAISSAKLCNFNREEEEELFKGTAEWIGECQTYEGGFGGAPYLEAHGGYSFCAIAALAILGREEVCQLNALLRWVVHRQMRYEGGFQGRTNKLVDGCYSFWQGAIVPIVQALISKKENNHELMHESLFNRQALQEYIFICCQRPGGGLIDKPGKPTDLYHTCYTLSGVSVSQHCDMNKPPLVFGYPENELLPTHPIHNIPPKCVIDAYKFFLKHEFREKEEVEAMNATNVNDHKDSREGSIESTTSSSSASSSSTSSSSHHSDKGYEEDDENNNSSESSKMAPPACPPSSKRNSTGKSASSSTTSSSRSSVERSMDEEEKMDY